jgi:hypothetical protein
MQHLDYTLPDHTMTRDAIVTRLQEIESDERIWYPAATVFNNAPLALIQVTLETEAQTLRKVLNLPMVKYHTKIKQKNKAFEEAFKLI